MNTNETEQEQLKKFKSEFNICDSLKDYENYLKKYHNSSDNPFVDQARTQIHLYSKVSLHWRIIIFIISVILAGLAMLGAFLFDGTSSSHLAMLGLALILVAVCILAFGIVMLVSSDAFYSIFKKYVKL